MKNVVVAENLSKHYGEFHALKGVSFSIREGECFGLLGHNGAGKSTTLRTISGLLKPKAGTVTFLGERIDGKEGHLIVKKGLCQSPEGRRIFPRMSVRENLELGAFLRNDKTVIAEDFEKVLELFPRLRERIEQKAGTMSGGEQQMLAVGRAMMGAPKLLLLDEPSMGLAPVLVDMIFETIVKIREQGITILLIEQNASAALDVADRAYVLESGTIKMSGKASDLAKDEAVTKAYLGG